MLRLYIAALVLMVMQACITDSDDGPALGVGDVVPQFEVVLADGSRFGTAQMRGKTSVVVFFTTACDDCRRELPLLQREYERLQADGADVPFACIARQESAATIEAFWASEGLTMPYSPQPDRKIYDMFATTGVPRLYIIGPDLVIVRAYSEELPPKLEI